MEKLRVGVIGVGYLGKFHAEKYSNTEGVELVGVVDTNTKAASEIAEKLGTKPFSDYKEFFGKVDAVSIVTPTPLHFQISMDFLKNGIDVLIEKPITTNVNEADELINYAASKGLIIQVGHLERFNPAVVAIADTVKKPMFIESHRLSMYKERCTDVSVVLDLMIHDIDIILNFVKSPIKSINAAGVPVISSYADIANARLEFQNGCIANVTASRISMKNERKIRLFQKDAYISLNFATREITVISQSDDPSNQTPGLIPGMQAKQITFTQKDALDDEIKAFVHSVKTREEPLVSGKVGRNALEIALSISEQIKITSTHFQG
ncbi:MAG: Gfo/Idh/MocA family oxidoreductase [Desulfobacterales bacterium]|nr:Gfo/Idh/MocA family oxidoreductase [Desulfobacterales bacterium]